MQGIDMATNNVTIPLSRATQNVTLNVKVSGVRVWKFRQTVGIWLIKLAARVMGVGVHVEVR